LRVSSSAVELDLLLSTRDDLNRATKAIEHALGPLLTIRELDIPSPQIDPGRAIREGIEFFNEERYWESHEALEYAWRKAVGDEKDVLQGIILVAAALVHLQKDQPTITVGVLKRAQEKLKGHESEYFDINLSELQENISRMLAAQRPEFFKINTKSQSKRAAA